MSKLSPTQRFSDRVENYVRYRPSYPPQALDHLEHVGYLQPGFVIADVGSGTGILSNQMIMRGYDVIGIEPNDAMRAASEALINAPNFRAVDAPAEDISLEDGAVDLVVVAQALHWFEHDKAAPEFRRITKAPHRMAAIWNNRRRGGTPFLDAYEELLLEGGVGYKEVMEDRAALSEGIRAYFGAYDHYSTPNMQVFDYKGLKGRLLSSSYAPAPGHPAHDAVIERLKAIFAEHNRDGFVQIEYDTQVYYGELG